MLCWPFARVRVSLRSLWALVTHTFPHPAHTPRQTLPFHMWSRSPFVLTEDASASLASGDILLNVNGIELTEVSRTEAVAILKSTSSSVVLKVLEVKEQEPQEDCSPEALDSNHNVTPPGDWSPSWVMWLELPQWVPNVIPLWMLFLKPLSHCLGLIHGHEHLANKTQLCLWGCLNQFCLLSANENPYRNLRVGVKV